MTEDGRQKEGVWGSFLPQLRGSAKALARMVRNDDSQGDSGISVCRRKEVAWRWKIRLDVVEVANGFVTEYTDVMCRLASGEKGAEMEKATVKEVTVKEGEKLVDRWRAETPEQVVHLLTMHGMDETDSLFPVAE